MATIKKRIPALRFPEFKGEWESKKTGEVANKISSGRSKTIQTNDFKYPLFGSTGVISYSNKFDYEGEKLLVARVGANAGFIYKVSGKYGVSDNTLIIEAITQVSLDFLLNSLQRLDLNKLAFGSGQPLVTGTLLNNLTVYKPILEEQQKIASFLSSVDERLQQLQQQQSLLEQYKKGCMQQIFSQKLRFKNDKGKAYPNWEEKILEEVGENIIGLTYSPKDIVKDGGYLVLRSSNIQDSRLDLNDQVRVKPKISNNLKIRKNDILICTRNGSQRLIGKNVLINEDYDNMTFGAFMSVFRSSQNNFITHLFKTDWFSKQVQMNLGARINQITTKHLNRFRFAFPSLQEQTKIANFLSAIDEQINTVKHQIAQTQQFKKGLLQQMFV